MNHQTERWLLGQGRCVLMFSGGRDSSIAASRLANKREELFLVTVSSSHLVGMDRVRNRVIELKALLPASTRWMIVQQPGDLLTGTAFYKRTCLPCHHAYVVTAAALARMTASQEVAFGYASYQNSWPEQTPFAVERLRAVLERHQLRLVLPVYDLPTRECATAELAARGLSGDALEQKCLRQVTNVTLGELDLTHQIEQWAAAVDASLTALDGLQLTIVNDVRVGSL